MAGSYPSRSDALDAAMAALGGEGEEASSTVRGLLERAGAVERCPVADASPHQAAALTRRFAIRQDLVFNVKNFLALLKAASKFVVGVATLKLLAGAPVVLDSLHGLYMLYDDVAAKAFRLSEREFAVLVVLKTLGSGTAPQIAEQLDGGFTTDSIEATLRRFERTEDRSNGFVVRDPAGLWTVEGL